MIITRKIFKLVKTLKKGKKFRVHRYDDTIYCALRIEIDHNFRYVKLYYQKYKYRITDLMIEEYLYLTKANCKTIIILDK